MTTRRRGKYARAHRRGFMDGAAPRRALGGELRRAHRDSSDLGAPMHAHILTASLRLVVPIAYGIKSIERVGSIRFGDERPRDYWAERGYDWYSTH